MNHMTKVILISAGDPDSISTEITIKAIQHSKMNKNVKVGPQSKRKGSEPVR